MRPIRLLLLGTMVATPLAAQGTAPQTPTAGRRAPATPADSAILRALDLPRVMQRARAAGIPDSSVRGIVDEMRRRGLPAEDAAAAAELEVEAVERGGQRDNFGSFVRSQVEAGVRGRDLAAAIRAERQRRGMGPGGAGGRPEGAGPPAGRGGRPATSPRPGADSARSKQPPTTGRRP